MNEPKTESSASDHAYFKELEAAFIELRGAPLLLSPGDWQIAKGWRRAGIPLELVVRVMERIFERQAGSGVKAGIRSLRYFETAVRRSWQRVLELGGGDHDEVGEASIDVSARLERLTAALPTGELSERSLRDRPPPAARALSAVLAEVAERLSSLSGSAHQVEAALQGLDRDMMDRLRAGLDAETVAQLTDAARENLAALSGRLTAEDHERTLELLVRRKLRQDLKLPVLSLFSREAVAPETG